jgi:hypothetical protein
MTDGQARESSSSEGRLLDLQSAGPPSDRRLRRCRLEPADHLVQSQRRQSAKGERACCPSTPTLDSYPLVSSQRRWVSPPTTRSSPSPTRSVCRRHCCCAPLLASLPPARLLTRLQSPATGLVGRNLVRRLPYPWRIALRVADPLASPQLLRRPCVELEVAQRGRRPRRGTLLHEQECAQLALPAALFLEELTP